MTDRDILRVEDLSLWIRNEETETAILHNISFSVAEGEKWAVAGESGAGKSMTMNAITALLPEASTRTTGRIMFREPDGSWQDLCEIPYSKRHTYIAGKIAVIFQDSINALNPNEKIIRQWGDTVKRFTPGISAKECRKHILSRMEIFEVRGADDTLRKYPHQLSGGQRQRIAIAMALESPAKILIADEPTTSLDAITQRSTVDFIAGLCAGTGRTLLYISHNLGILQYVCDHVMVFENGRIVEQGEADDVFFRGRADYTKQLVRGTLSIMGEEQNRMEKYNARSGGE